MRRRSEHGAQSRKRKRVSLTTMPMQSKTKQQLMDEKTNPTASPHLAPHAFPLCALTAHEPAPRTPRRHRRSPRSRRRRQERRSACSGPAARCSRPTSWRMPRLIRDCSLMKPPSVEGFPIHLSRRGLELGGCLRIRTNDDDSACLTTRPPPTDRALRKRPCAPDTLRRGRMCCCWRRVRARPVPFDRLVINVRTACYGERADRIRDTFLR